MQVHGQRERGARCVGYCWRGRMPAAESELMGRYCDGDTAAFRELYAQIAPRLLGYLIRMAGNRPVAEDLLQQTFLKVHRARSAYVRGADPLPWIYAIAHRTFLDDARGRSRARVQVARDPDTVPEPRADLSGRAEDAAGPAPADPELTRAAL